MSTMTHQIQAEPVPTRGGLIPLPHAAKNPRAKWVKWILAIGFAVLVAAGGLFWRAHAQNAIRYETIALERGTIQASVTATGTLNAVVDVQVGSQVSGNIKALYADFNTRVKKGQLVALIDPQIFQAQVEQAQAGLGSLHSAVITAGAQIEKARADLAASAASVKSAEAVLAKDQANELNAKAQWERAEGLFAAKVMSQQDYDSARAIYDAIRAQVVADQSQIDAAKQAANSAAAQVRVAESQLVSGQAQERQAQAVLNQTKINLAHTRITAPVDGTVIARRMDVGQTVAASFQAPTIFEIAQDLTKMQVDTNVDEADIGNIAPGQTGTFTVDSYPGTTFRGQVTDVRKAPITAQNVVTYDVVIAVSNPDFKLFPGMTANVTILTARLDDILKVPNSALRFRPSADVMKQSGLGPAQAGKQQIYVLKGGKLRAAPATLGLSDGKFTAITAPDLRTGELVVVRAKTAATSSTSSTSSSRPQTPRF
jgi:HlyD family secretion protein